MYNAMRIPELPLEPPDYPEEPAPRCPVCGKETDTFYKGAFEIFGCGNCIRAVDAWDEK